MKEITRGLYMHNYAKLNQNQKNAISPNQYSDKYYALFSENTIVACAGLRREKNNMVQLNGLFSLKKGYGAILLKEVEDTIPHSYLRLNCSNSGLLSYYSKQGFESYFIDGDYVELHKKNL